MISTVDFYFQGCIVSIVTEFRSYDLFLLIFTSDS